MVYSLADFKKVLKLKKLPVEGLIIDVFGGVDVS